MIIIMIIPYDNFSVYWRIFLGFHDELPHRTGARRVGFSLANTQRNTMDMSTLGRGTLPKEVETWLATCHLWRCSLGVHGGLQGIY